MFVLLALAGMHVSVATAQAPSFDCRKARASAEREVCNAPELAALDRQLSVVYAAARRQTTREQSPTLKAEQRGWIKGRNDCWKSPDLRTCVADAYRTRIAELQARYRLVPATARATYVCNGEAGNEIAVVFFPTDPPTLIAERGDSVSLMYQQPSASGSRYQGRNESFWEHQGEATVVSGHGAPDMRCKPLPAPQDMPLSGTTWELTAIQSMDDAQGTTRIEHHERFTLHFAPNGQARFRIDCNRGFASWTGTASSEVTSGSLNFGQLATTKMMCPPDSQDQRWIQALPYVRSYLIKDGRLYLSLLADGGIFEWRPVQP
jgi:uncharacterized protein/heat shock protein HslJ